MEAARSVIEIRGGVAQMRRAQIRYLPEHDRVNKSGVACANNIEIRDRPNSWSRLRTSLRKVDVEQRTRDRAVWCLTELPESEQRKWPTISDGDVVVRCTVHCARAWMAYG